MFKNFNQFMEAKGCKKVSKKIKPKSDKPSLLPDVWKNPKNENEIPELNGQKPFPPQLIKYLADLSQTKKNITENIVYEFKKAGMLKTLVKNIFDYNESYEILANLFGEKTLGVQRCNSFAKAIHESVRPPVSLDDEESDRPYPRKKELNSMDDSEFEDEEDDDEFEDEDEDEYSDDDEESLEDGEEEMDSDSDDEEESDEDDDRFEFGDDQEFGDDDDDRPNGFEQSPPSEDQMGDEESDDLSIRHSNKSRAHRNFMRSMNRYNSNY